MRKKVSLLVLIGAIGLLILIAGLLYTGTALGSRANDRHQAEIEYFEEELKNPQLSQEGRQLIQKKLDIVESEATQLAYGLEHPGTHGDKFTLHPQVLLWAADPQMGSIMTRQFPDPFLHMRTSPGSTIRGEKQRLPVIILSTLAI